MNRSGSPSMEDIEAFSSTYRAWLGEAEVAKLIPENISLEVCFFFSKYLFPFVSLFSFTSIL